MEIIHSEREVDKWSGQEAALLKQIADMLQHSANTEKW